MRDSVSMRGDLTGKIYKRGNEIRKWAPRDQGRRDTNSGRWQRGLNIVANRAGY